MSQETTVRSSHDLASSWAELAGDWELDASHTKVGIKTRSMWGLVAVKGHFTDVSGAGRVGADGEVSGTLRLATGSLDTNNPKRDSHLRSADFFDVERFPVITFTAAGASPTATGVRIDGTLEVKGTARRVQIPMTVAEADSRSVVLTGTIEIDRSDYGMDWNQMGMARMTNEITFEVTFVR